MAGYATGHYMDEQESVLREKLERTGVQVVKEGDSIRLIMPSNVMFKSSSDIIDNRFYPVLDSISLVLAEFDKTQIVVTGHTDSTGSFKTNQVLSESRAFSVASYMLSEGVAKSRIRYNGLSDRQPVGNNKTKVGRAKNRRVEIQIFEI